METRNIQKTGEMHYVYLPTSWCRDRKLAAGSRVGISYGGDGSLVISPQIAEKKPKHLKFSINEDDQDIIHKLVVASYINPASSFEITLQKEMDFTKLLNQKRLISLESVEIDQKRITCEGPVSVVHPESLLKTMVKKIKNMMIVMEKNYDKELIERYEDEIDRSKMLIDKAVISSLMFEGVSKTLTIELYYISLISKELERLVDGLINLEKKDVKFISEIEKPIELLGSIVDHEETLTLETALGFAKMVSRIKKRTVVDVRTYEMERMKQNLVTVSEVIMDWMVTRKLESKN
jgi:antitoxin component of MazEF toxin-antitoxin module